MVVVVDHRGISKKEKEKETRRGLVARVGLTRELGGASHRTV